MSPVRSFTLLACAAALSAPSLMTAREPVEPVRYTVLDVGTLGGATSEAFGVNRDGWVVGRSDTPEGKRHAFLFFPGAHAIRADGSYVGVATGKPSVLDLTPTRPGNSEARAINDPGTIVGSIDTEAGKQAALWHGTSETILGPDEAYSINNRGQVGGVNILWQTDLGKAVPATPFVGETLFYVYGLDRTGRAVGAELFDDTHGTTRPFLRDGGKFQTLAQPVSKAAPAAAYAINSTGQVVGADGRQAFLWQGGKLTYLSGPAVRSSIAYALNDEGQIVGQADVSLRDQSLRAVLWQNGTMTDLNKVIDARSGWTLEEARGINERGQICGTGTFGGRCDAFLITPEKPSALR